MQTQEQFVPVSPREVMVTTAGLRTMRKAWPCSGLPFDACVIFEFDSHGNLCDIKWFSDEGIDIAEPSGVDGACLCALSEDAYHFLDVQQAIEHVSRNPQTLGKD